MKVKDFEGTAPKLAIEEYLAGETRAWGLFEDRFGNLRRQFVVDIIGTWDGDVLTLDERFLYSDGEREQRVWRVRKTGPHRYEGRADDIVGAAMGEAYGNALNWHYDMTIGVGGRHVTFRFDDWMLLQPSGAMLNRVRVSKFGIRIGEITLAYIKAGGPAPGAVVSEPKDGA